MSTKKKYSKSKFLKEAVETYKSILIAEGFLDVLVDLVFGRQIVAAGNALAKDPVYVKTVKELEAIEKKLKELAAKQIKADKAREDFYFIIYGIDLSELDDRTKFQEMELIKRKLGKYKNLKPLNKKQQELNRKLVAKRR
jgi:hypothetical protein